MKRNILIFGSIAGLIVAIFMVVSTGLCYSNPDYKGSMLLGYAGMLLAFSFVFVGIKNYRDKYCNRVITFGQAFKVGSLIMLVASTIYVVVWLFDYYLFVPDFIEWYTAHVLTQAKAEGKTTAEINSLMSQMDFSRKMYKTPFGVILLTYMEILPVGLVVTLISALILKRRPKTTEPVIA